MNEAKQENANTLFRPNKDTSNIGCFDRIASFMKIHMPDKPNTKRKIPCPPGKVETPRHKKTIDNPYITAPFKSNSPRSSADQSPGTLKIPISRTAIASGI